MVLGREAERARVDALLEAARRGRTGSLVISGEPGIGKTALLGNARERAAGMRVLALTAAEGESALAFAGLDALLRPLAHLFGRLEAPQERSLRVALALEDGGAPDALAVNSGTLRLLAEAAAEQPLLVAVDDAHWLDRPSADALAFAARRLEGEELAFLFAVRLGEAAAFAGGFEHIELRPLAQKEARELLRLRSEHVPSAIVDRMLELAAGNPLALLELPNDFATANPGDELTAPDRVRRAFAARLESLPESSRRALVLAAAEPDPATVRHAIQMLELDEEALDAAESAELVRVDPGGMSFRHPLVRSLAYASASAAERRAAHRALAEALPEDADRDRRAWHLAAAAPEPDEELAALLEETADRATARGGHAAAARALERAALLSRDRDAAARRLCRAARAAFWAGEAEHGIELTEAALASTQDPVLRADALFEAASIRGAQGVSHDEERLLAQLAAVGDVDADRATRLLFLSVSTRVQALDVAGAMELTPRLEEAARRAGPWWGPRGLANVAEAHLAAGDSDRFGEILAELIDDDAVTAAFAGGLIWAERYDAVRHALEATLRDGRASGNRMRVIWNQNCLAQLELRLGRLPQARVAASEAITVGEAHGTALWVCEAQCSFAGVQAWQGDDDACRRTAAEAIAIAQGARSVPNELTARWALGLLALGLGRPEEAIDELAPAARRWHESSFLEPSAVAFLPDLVEAYAQNGEAEAAQLWLERFRSAAEQAKRQWALAAVARCQGLLAAQPAFEEAFEHSLELLVSSPLTLDRARTQLVYGERLRRAGRRREARSHLRAAHEAFSSVDAAPWAERAAAELRATGATVGPRSPDRRSSLTPQELQIARLVGEGKTNREIAAQLYLSPKTIEYHLANAYRKVDVHSRAELTRIMLAEGPERGAVG